MKVIANGQHFKFPFVARKMDERKLSDYGDRQGFILYKNETGATWRVGQFARAILFGEKGKQDNDSMQGFYTVERFISAEFTAGLRSAIAKAITLSGLYERQADLDIRLIAALPHAVRAKYASTVIGLAAGEYSYYMTFNADAEKRFHFTIEKFNIYTNQILKHYKKTGLMDDEHMLLTIPTLNGESLPIEFAITTGAYKGLCGKIN